MTLPITLFPEPGVKSGLVIPVILNEAAGALRLVPGFNVTFIASLLETLGVVISSLTVGTKLSGFTVTLTVKGAPSHPRLSKGTTV